MPLEHDEVSSIERLKCRSLAGDKKRRIVEKNLEPGDLIAGITRRFNLNIKHLSARCGQQGVLIK